MPKVGRTIFQFYVSYPYCGCDTLGESLGLLNDNDDDNDNDDAMQELKNLQRRQSGLKSGGLWTWVKNF